MGYLGENQHRQKIGNFFQKSLHAEVNALFKYNKNRKKIRNVSMYVVRLNSNYFGLAKPCPNCQYFLKSHKITRVYYTDFIDNKNVLCRLDLQ
jgi:deoxycytidylate deaminase